MTDDTETRVRNFLHGLVRNPGRAFITEEQRAAYLASSPPAAPPEPPPPGTQVRVKTRDDMVEVIETRDDGSSLKLYGPFATADEQRAFMANVWRTYVGPGPKLDAVLEATAAWRRYDEP